MDTTTAAGMGTAMATGLLTHSVGIVFSKSLPCGSPPPGRHRPTRPVTTLPPVWGTRHFPRAPSAPSVRPALAPPLGAVRRRGVGVPSYKAAPARAARGGAPTAVKGGGHSLWIGEWGGVRGRAARVLDGGWCGRRRGRGTPTFVAAPAAQTPRAKRAERWRGGSDAAASRACGVHPLPKSRTRGSPVGAQPIPRWMDPDRRPVGKKRLLRRSRSGAVYRQTAMPPLGK